MIKKVSQYVVMSVQGGQHIIILCSYYLRSAAHPNLEAMQVQSKDGNGNFGK